MNGLIDLPLAALLNRTIVPKVKARFGGRMKALVSGGAPLNPEVGTFFQSLGLTLLQGYGQTEAGPVASVNRPSAGIKMDTVGPPLKNTEIRIADDGEILLRGELVMKGYWRNESETAKALRDGWLHTGDIGELDAAGRLMITDRKKDLIVNDKGDNISPQKVEGMLTLQHEIGQVMIYGDRRPHLVALVVPDPEWMKEWAGARGKTPTLDALRDDPDFVAAVRAVIDRVNADLSVIEKVRRFAFADEPFTIDNEMLTPKQSIRRHVIRAHYQARLDGAVWRAGLGQARPAKRNPGKHRVSSPAQAGVQPRFTAPNACCRVRSPNGHEPRPAPGNSRFNDDAGSRPGLRLRRRSARRGGIGHEIAQRAAAGQGAARQIDHLGDVAAAILAAEHLDHQRVAEAQAVAGADQVVAIGQRPCSPCTPTCCCRSRAGSSRGSTRRSPPACRPPCRRARSAGPWLRWERVSAHRSARWRRRQPSGPAAAMRGQSVSS